MSRKQQRESERKRKMSTGSAESEPSPSAKPAESNEAYAAAEVRNAAACVSPGRRRMNGNRVAQASSDGEDPEAGETTAM